MLLSMKSFKVYGVGTLFLFIFVILSAGCVKENRDKCPCRLIVDLSDVDSSRISSVDVLLAGEGGIVYETIRHSDSYGSDEVVLVPRDELFLNVCWGDGGMMGMDGLVIPEGLDCPPVYMYSALVSASSSEFIRQSVIIRKNHCVMKIYVEDDGAGFPFDMTLVGNVCGYCADGTPMPGRFNCSPEMVGKSSYIVNLPRQRDASLILEVNDGSQVVKTFALGEYVKACGYDWTEEDLKDVTVGIDYARTQIRIAVQGWDEVYEFDIVI